jgi:N-methylhydantoinase A
MLAIRLGVVGETVKPELDAGAADGAPDAAGAVIGQRLIWSGAAGALVDAPVYDGHRLGAGATLAGPAIVALDTTTIVVPADFELLVDRFGAFVLHSGERGRDAAAAFMPGTLGSVAT